jgi:hypothetical protein
VTVRQQLTEALDRGEREFKHEHTWTCAITAEDGPSCDCGLSDLMARLVERDRSLLNEWWSTKNAAGRLSDYGEGRLEILTEQVNAAAAFWVGTPEVDR